MGYKREPRVYTLIFDDPEFNGLEVKARSVSIRDMRLLSEEATGTEEMLTVFAKALLSWNLEDENGPVPATTEGIDSQDMDLIMAVIDAWATAVSGVEEELGKGSSSGSRSLVESLPMEPLSPSLAS